MKKKILLILIGGTICTALNEQGHLSVCAHSGGLLKANFERSDSPYAKLAEIEESENLRILSENMTVEKWNRILDTYRQYVADKKYDGVIIAHGTDTLAYSAALLAQLLCDTEIPILLVSANAPLSDPRSNGNANFRCAAECICAGMEPNVYAVYQNISDGKMYLHLGSRLRQCPDYSEDFHSEGMLELSEEKREESLKALGALYPSSLRASCPGKGLLKPCVLMLEPYVGLDYSAIDYEKYAAVLHGTYHSGTACVQSDGEEHSILWMLDHCDALGVEVYLSPALRKEGTYESIPPIAEREVAFLYGCTKETAYAKLLIACSMMDRAERRAYMEKECNFEQIYKG